MNLKRISKFISLVLRHEPDAAGITLDPEGWAEVDALLAGMRARGMDVDLATLEQVVAENDKQRFAFDADHTYIRANQGHSVAVDLGLEPVSPREVLYHGTVERFWPVIQSEGLKPQSRQYVHLSAELATAANVGSRRGKPFVLHVRAGDLHRTGHVFYRSANGVWLTDFVPPAFISPLK